MTVELTVKLNRRNSVRIDHATHGRCIDSRMLGRFFQTAESILKESLDKARAERSGALVIRRPLSECVSIISAKGDTTLWIRIPRDISSMEKFLRIADNGFEAAQPLVEAYAHVPLARDSVKKDSAVKRPGTNLANTAPTQATKTTQPVVAKNSVEELVACEAQTGVPLLKLAVLVLKQFGMLSERGDIIDILTATGNLDNWASNRAVWLNSGEKYDETATVLEFAKEARARGFNNSEITEALKTYRIAWKPEPAVAIAVPGGEAQEKIAAKKTFTQCRELIANYIRGHPDFHITDIVGLVKAQGVLTTPATASRILSCWRNKGKGRIEPCACKPNGDKKTLGSCRDSVIAFINERIAHAGNCTSSEVLAYLEQTHEIITTPGGLKARMAQWRANGFVIPHLG